MRFKVWFDVDMELWSGKDHVTSHSITINAENKLDAIRNCGEEIRHLMKPGEFRQGLEGKVKSITFDHIEECVDEDSRLSLIRKDIQKARDDAKLAAAKEAQKIV